MALEIIRAADLPDEFSRLSATAGFAAVEEHPFTGGFGRSYYPKVMGDTRRDESFVAVENGVPVALVPCSMGEGLLDWYGMPMRVFASSELPPASRSKAAAAAFSHLDKIIDTVGLTGASILDEGDGGLLSPAGQACLNRGWRGELRFCGRCELTDAEATTNRALRKSFRSLVNWGRANLSLDVVNAAEPDRQRFAEYQAFHLRVAGRSTRPQASWDAMFDWIAHGGGELTLGRLASGELVAGTLIVDGARVASYASGVYDRERFDKPMAHWPLLRAIHRSAERGKCTFDLGDIPQAGTVSPKEYAIGYFKRGFAGDIHTSIVWTWRRQTPTREVGHD